MKYKLSELVEYLSVPAFVFECVQEKVVAANSLMLRSHGTLFTSRNRVKVIPRNQTRRNDTLFLSMAEKSPFPVFREIEAEQATFQMLMISEPHGIVFERVKGYSDIDLSCAGLKTSGHSESFHLSYVYNIATGKRIFSTPQQLRELGFNSDDGADWHHLIATDDRATYDQTIADIIKNGGNHELHYRICRQDGSYCAITDYCGMTKPDHQWPVLAGTVICRPPHDESAIMAERQVLTSRMLGGMIHDFKNLLGGIRNTIEWSAGISGEPEVIEALKKTLSYTDQATELIVGTLRLSHGKADQHNECIDVAAVVEEVKDLVTRIVPASINLEVSVRSPIPRIYGPKSLLKDMLLNLCVNARDAMKEKGSMLKIDLGAMTAAGDNGSETGNCVCIEISDDGCGMSKAEVNRIFDAFYSTKPHGVGLGMWMVKNAISAFSGRIELTSDVGCGSTFKVFLPETVRPECKVELNTTAAKISPKHVPCRGRNGKGKTLLYIEDNVLVSGSVSNWLESLGFRILFAEDGLKGKEIFDRYASEIDLIIQDYVLPGIKGDELLQAFLSRRPDIPVIVVSAENDADCIQRLISLGAREMIRKPFKMEELLSSLFRIIDTRP